MARKKGAALAADTTQVDPSLFTRAEAARYLHVSVRQLVRFVRDGLLAEIAMNHVTRRYRREDLDAFAASRRVPAKGAT